MNNDSNKSFQVVSKASNSIRVVVKLFKVSLVTYTARRHLLAVVGVYESKRRGQDERQGRMGEDGRIGERKQPESGELRCESVFSWALRIAAKLCGREKERAEDDCGEEKCRDEE